MTIKRLDDIEREKAKENRERIKNDITEDVNDVIGNIFKKPKKRTSFFGILFFIIKFLGILSLMILVVNLFLGNIWLLKFFIKNLFLSS